jgi:hypothetical protein
MTYDQWTTQMAEILRIEDPEERERRVAALYEKLAQSKPTATHQTSVSTRR